MKSKNPLVVELYNLMTKAGLTIEDLDKRSGVSSDFIESWFEDRCKPSLESLQFCFQALGYDLQPIETSRAIKIIQKNSEENAAKDLIRQGEQEQLLLLYKEASGLIIKLYNKLKYEDRSKYQNHITACKSFIVRNSLYERIL